MGSRYAFPSLDKVDFLVRLPATLAETRLRHPIAPMGTSRQNRHPLSSRAGLRPAAERRKVDPCPGCHSASSPYRLLPCMGGFAPDDRPLISDSNCCTCAGCYLHGVKDGELRLRHSVLRLGWP